MTKEKYKLEFEELKSDENYKYFITGSPTHLRWTVVAKANSLKELWEGLMEMNEIDMERYERDYEVFDTKREIYYYNEPENYEVAIKEYLSTSNSFYYRKMNF